MPMPCSPVIVPAAREGRVEDPLERAVHARELIGVAVVDAAGRMQVAVAGVPEDRDQEALLLGDLLHLAHHAGELGARHGRVLEDQRRREAGERGDRAAARREQLAGRVLVGRDLDADRALLAADLGHLGGVALDHGRGAVLPEDQHRAGVRGQPEVGALVDDAHRRLVEELQRRGQDAVLDDAADRARGRLEVAEVGRAGRLRLGRGQQLERDLGEHGERPLGADEQPHEVVAGDVLRQLAADARNVAPPISTASMPIT